MVERIDFPTGAAIVRDATPYVPVMPQCSGSIDVSRAISDGAALDGELLRFHPKSLSLSSAVEGLLVSHLHLHLHFHPHLFYICTPAL